MKEITMFKIIKQRLDFKVPFPSQAGNESLAYLENETMVKLDNTDSFNIEQDFEILLSRISNQTEMYLL